LLAFELAGELFDGRREHANAFVGDVGPTRADESLVAIAERMRNDDDRQAYVADAFTDDLGERRESGTDDRDGRDLQIFECGRVTRGPGCRRASVADAVDDGIAARGHFLGIRRGYPEITFLPELHLGNAMVALQHLGDTAQHDVRELLAVIEYSDARTPNAFQARRKRLGLGVDRADRHVDRHAADRLLLVSGHE